MTGAWWDGGRPYGAGATQEGTRLRAAPWVALPRQASPADATGEGAEGEGRCEPGGRRAGSCAERMPLAFCLCVPAPWGGGRGEAGRGASSRPAGLLVGHTGGDVGPTRLASLFPCVRGLGARSLFSRRLPCVSKCQQTPALNSPNDARRSTASLSIEKGLLSFLSALHTKDPPKLETVCLSP